MQPELAVDALTIFVDLVEKGGPGSGEPEGHPFRGNQYTEGSSSGGERVEQPQRVGEERTQGLRDRVIERMHSYPTREHAAVTVDGETHVIEGDDDGVNIPDNIVDQVTSIVHNHPNGGALSGHDVRFLMTRKNMQRIEAITEDGEKFIMEKPPGFRTHRTGFAITNVYLDTLDDLDAKYEEDKSLDHVKREKSWREHTSETCEIVAKKFGLIYRREGSGSKGEKGKPKEKVIYHTRDEGGFFLDESTIIPPWIKKRTKKGGAGSGAEEGHEFRGNQYVTVFHGTEFANMKEMLSEGIRSGEYRNFSNRFYEGGRGGKVFVTADGATAFHIAATFGVIARGQGVTDPVVVEAHVPKEYFDKNAEKDEIANSEWNEGMAYTLPEVKAEWITDVWDTNGKKALESISSLTGRRFKKKADTTRIYFAVSLSALKKFLSKEAEKSGTSEGARRAWETRRRRGEKPEEDDEERSWRGDLIHANYDDLANSPRGREEYFRKLRESRTRKGGAGSGEQEGHPFRGNQYTEGVGEGDEPKAGEVNLEAGDKIEDFKEFRKEVMDWPVQDDTEGMKTASNRSVAKAALYQMEVGLSKGFVVKDGSEMVGAVSFKNQNDHFLYVSALATKRHGYGRKIMAEVAKVATEKKQGITLDALPSAYGFYTKLGFRRNGAGADLDDLIPMVMFGKETRELAKAASKKIEDDEPPGCSFCVDPEILKSISKKGGPGSGEPEGHPFRGNQYTTGEEVADAIIGGEKKPSGDEKKRRKKARQRRADAARRAWITIRANRLRRASELSAWQGGADPSVEEAKRGAGQVPWSPPPPEPTPVRIGVEVEPLESPDAFFHDGREEFRKPGGDKWSNEIDHWADSRCRWIGGLAASSIYGSGMGRLLMNKGEFVGIVAYTNPDHPRTGGGRPDGRLYINDIAAKERRKGYGEYLLREMARIAAPKGLGLQLSGVYDALPFYKKMGMIHFYPGDHDHSGGLTEMYLSAANTKKLAKMKFRPMAEAHKSEDGLDARDLEPEGGGFCMTQDQWDAMTDEDREMFSRSTKEEDDEARGIFEVMKYGTATSGNWGHAGIQGHQGGSAPAGQAQTAFSQTLKNKGASISIRGNPPKHGYMVSTYKEREKVIPLMRDRSKLVQAFKEYRDQNKDVLKRANHYFGAWVDVKDGKKVIYLDVSRRIDNKSSAMRVGRTHKQEAIYDVQRGNVINL